METWKKKMGNIKKYVLGKYIREIESMENKKWENIKKIGNIESLKNMELKI